jgi:hypothetical protein
VTGMESLTSTLQPMSTITNVGTAQWAPFDEKQYLVQRWGAFNHSFGQAVWYHHAETY